MSPIRGNSDAPGMTGGEPKAKVGRNRAHLADLTATRKALSQH